MMSRNSFWIDLKENWKRRLWPFALFSIILFFLYPILISMDLRTAIMQDYTGALLDAQKRAAWHLGYNEMSIFLVCLAAIINAYQGFGYLYHRDRVDMMQSQPISPARRFFVIYLNGILVYMIPYLVMVLIGNIIAGSMNCLTAWTTLSSLWSVLMSLVTYLAIYHVAILAIMMTGNLVVTVLGTATFLFYEPLIRIVMQYMHSEYFTSYVNMSESTLRRGLWTTPLDGIIGLANINDNIWDLQTMTGGQFWGKIIALSLPILLKLFIKMSVYFGLAWLCYRKRPMESAGNAMAFDQSKGMIKTAFLLLGSLAFVLVMKSAATDMEVYPIIGLVAGILITQTLMETIFEFDIKAFAGRKVWLGIGAALSVVTYLYFVADPFGYDRYVPSSSDVKSTAVYVSYHNDNELTYFNYDFDNYYYGATADENATYGFPILKEMELTDPSTISSILAIAQKSMGKEYGETETGSEYTAVVKYTLKNGDQKYRRMVINDDDVSRELDQLFADSSYKNAILQLDDHSTEMMIEKTRDVTFYNGLDSVDIDADPARLLEAYQSDLEKMTYSDVKRQVPLGTIEMEISLSSRNYTATKSLPLYASFTETVSYLRSVGAKVDISLNPSEVKKIVATDYRSDYDELIGGYPSVTYTDDDQIAEIMACSVPYYLGWYAFDMGGIETGLDYELTYQESGVEDMCGFYPLKEQIPKFVMDDLQYIP